MHRAPATDRLADSFREPATWRKEAGSALVKVLLLTAVMLALAAVGARTTRVELRISQNDAQSKRAQAVAEAGISDAFKRIVVYGLANGFNDELENGGTGGALAGVGTLVTDPFGGEEGQNYRFKNFGGTSSDGYYVHAADNFDETAGENLPQNDLDKRIKLISRGRVGRAERTIETMIKPVPEFGGGIFAKKDLTFGGGGTTDSYNSSYGAYGGSNINYNGDVGANGDIKFNGTPTTIGGDATAGGTGTWGQATVTGQATDGASPISYPPVTPCGPPYNAGTTILGGNYNVNTGDLRTNGQNDDIVISSGDYCLNSITLTASNTLSVNIIDGVPVRIWLTGDSNLTGGGVVNPTGVPLNLQISSSVNSTTQGITIAGGSSASMTIYAPDAHISITGSSSFFGGVVGGNVDVSGGTAFHYDEALANGPALAAQLVDWHEVRNN